MSEHFDAFMIIFDAMRYVNIYDSSKILGEPSQFILIMTEFLFGR